MNAMQYGFLVGQRLTSSNVKTAVNLGGIVKAITGAGGAAANAASATKPVAAAATSAQPAVKAVSGGGITGADLIPWGKDHSQAMTNYTAAAQKANPHYQPVGGPIKMAPPAGSAPSVRPAAPPPLPAVPARGPQAAAPAAAGAPQATSAQRAQMHFDEAQSGGRQQMLGYGQRGAPSNLPQKWDQLSPEQQATVTRTLGY
jgi:hypothetical protein